MNLEEIKAKYPAYADIPDQELADKIYQKHYADKLPIEEFYTKIGYNAQPRQMQEAPIEENYQGVFGDPEKFKSTMEDFYRSSGIHGANRGFAKLFSPSGSQHQYNTQQSYEQAKETNPWATEAGNIGAQLYGSIPFMQLAGGATGGMAPGIAKTAATAGLGASAKAGYETPYDDETRLGNIAKEGIGGAAFAGAGHLAGKGLGKAATLVKQGAKSKNTIAEGISKTAKGFKEKYTGPTGLFEGFIENAEKNGIKTDLTFTPRTTKIINKELDGVTKGARKAVIKAHKTNDVTRYYGCTIKAWKVSTQCI